MKGTDPITNPMDEKRKALLDNCTRALCGDTTLDSKLLDAATGGRYSAGKNENGSNLEQIKTLVLALRWLELPTETAPKTRRRRTTKKASAGNGAKPVAKKRGRPKGSKNKTTTKDNSQMEIQTQDTAPIETPTEPQVETPPEPQAPIPMTPPADLKDVTFEGGGLPQ